jgi:hypothetical protein
MRCAVNALVGDLPNPATQLGVEIPEVARRASK